MQATLQVTERLRGQRGPDHVSSDDLVQSQVGRSISRAIEQQRHLRNGSYWFDPIQRRRLKADLRALAAECAKPDWDGEGADPVLPMSLVHAIRFVESMPMGYAEPDPGVDPDGEISFSWIGVKGHRLSLSIGPTGRISYAHRYGPRRRNGTEWLGDVIPEELLERIGKFPTNG